MNDSVLDKLIGWWEIALQETVLTIPVITNSYYMRWQFSLVKCNRDTWQTINCTTMNILIYLTNKDKKKHTVPVLSVLKYQTNK